MLKRSKLVAFWFNDWVCGFSPAEIVGTFAVIVVLSFVALCWAIRMMVDSTINQLTGR